MATGSTQMGSTRIAGTDENAAFKARAGEVFMNMQELLPKAAVMNWPRILTRTAASVLPDGGGVLWWRSLPLAIDALTCEAEHLHRYGGLIGVARRTREGFLRSLMAPVTLVLAMVVLALTACAADVRAASDGVAAPVHEFYFTRGNYGGESGEFGPRWAVDFPKADEQFLVALKRLSVVDAYPHDHALEIDRPSLREFPFLYMLEVGSLDLDARRAARLRDYLLAGGFLVIDDFWGSFEWNVFEAQMRRIFPGRPIEPVAVDHPVFHAFYDIREVIQVPNVYQGATGGATHENDGYTPQVRGVFDDSGRLMVLINWNTDLGDGWEWADHPQYPLRFSTYSYEMGINFVIYAMSY